MWLEWETNVAAVETLEHIVVDLVGDLLLLEHLLYGLTCRVGLDVGPLPTLSLENPKIQIQVREVE